MEKIFKHEERIIRARIELEHDSKSSSHENEYVAKGHLELKGKTITISVLSENIYKAVDDLVEKLDRGLRRRARLRRGHLVLNAAHHREINLRLNLQLRAQRKEERELHVVHWQWRNRGFTLAFKPRSYSKILRTMIQKNRSPEPANVGIELNRIDFFNRKP